MAMPVTSSYLTELFPTKFRGISLTGGFVFFVMGEIYICILAWYLSPNLEPTY